MIGRPSPVPLHVLALAGGLAVSPWTLGAGDGLLAVSAQALAQGRSGDAGPDRGRGPGEGAGDRGRGPGEGAGDRGRGPDGDGRAGEGGRGPVDGSRGRGPDEGAGEGNGMGRGPADARREIAEEPPRASDRGATAPGRLVASGAGAGSPDAEDMDMAEAASRSGRGPVRILRVEVTRSDIDIAYADGSREAIRNGRYLRHDRADELVEARPARGSDVARLRAIGNRVAVPVAARPADATGATLAGIERRGADIAVVYANGWREAVTADRYRMHDRFGRLVVDRPARSGDRARLEELDLVP